MNREETLEMIREIRGYPLLTGTREFAGFDIEKLAELSQLFQGSSRKR